MSPVQSASPSFPIIRALIAFLLAAGFLGATLYQAEAARSNGVEITLETRPIDPRDLFFGHYATLGYKVQDEDIASFASEATIDALSPKGDDYTHKDDAYVAVVRKEQFHEIVLLTQSLEEASAAGVALKVRTTATRNKRCREELKVGGLCPSRFRAQVDLPRRYYADEETALALENKARASGVRLRVEQNYERCLKRRARAMENPDAASIAECEAPEIAGKDLRFGVILSVSDEGKAVIKGLAYDNARVIDTLNGPRLSLVRDNTD